MELHTLESPIISLSPQEFESIICCRKTEIQPHVSAYEYLLTLNTNLTSFSTTMFKSQCSWSEMMHKEGSTPHPIPSQIGADALRPQI